jgi:hypothetical protein
MIAVAASMGVGGFAGPARAEVNVNIGIGLPPPPPLFIPAPPPVIPIPRTYVYFPPSVEIDLFFYGGYWYRPHRDHWFRSHSYNGPWVFVEPRRVPRAVVRVPPGYRHVPPGHRQIPYGQFKKNWQHWERDKYWDRDHDWRSEYWRYDRRPPGPPPEGYGKYDKKHDKWGEGGPPGHQGKGKGR